MAGIDVKTVTMKFMDLIDYAIYHAPLLRNHKEFGERMRDVRFEIGSIEENYQRVLLAAKGRGMVSEMLNMEEAVVLVCGLHDKVLRLEAAQQSVQPTKAIRCACGGEMLANYRCQNCGLASPL